MRFQSRDGEILKAIFDNDGVLGKRHLKNWFWPDKTWRAMEQRLSKLYHAGYISWPSKDQRKNYPIPEPVCWLGWKGALYIAELFGVDVIQPTKVNENQLRNFQQRLRQNGIRWVREPRWSMLRHDLTVTDFRVAVIASLGQLPGFTLRKWITESEFRSNMDRVMFRMSNGDGSVRTIERGICPDAYFEIVNEDLRVKNEPHKIRLLLEIDMATHDNLSFGREKVAPGVAYVKSQEYRDRFGGNSGLWLVVTGGGDRRMRNLVRQTCNQVGRDARMFYFTTLDQIININLFATPIWLRADSSYSMPLLS